MFSEIDDMLKEKFLALINRNKKDGAGDREHKVPTGLEDEGAPIFLMLGSLSDVSKKDAQSYVRGLAERYVVTPQLGRIYLHTDKDNNRILYEIHEGGPDRVIIPGVIEALKKNQENPIYIQLAGGGYISVENVKNELVTLVYPAPSSDPHSLNEQVEVIADSVINYCGHKRLNEMFPEENALPRVGWALLSIALLFFLSSLGLFTAHRLDITSPDDLFASAKKGVIAKDEDMPTVFMERATSEANIAGKHIHVLKKQNKKWTWELRE